MTLECRDIGGHRHHAECAHCRRCVSVEAGHQFRDRESFDEWRISGICQSCQDEIFPVR